MDLMPELGHLFGSFCFGYFGLTTLLHWGESGCRRPPILCTVQEYFWRADKVRHNTCDKARPLSQVWGADPTTSSGYELAEPTHYHHLIAGVQDCIPT